MQLHMYKQISSLENISYILGLLKKELKPKQRMKFVVISGVLSEKSADAIEIRYLEEK